MDEQGIKFNLAVSVAHHLASTELQVRGSKGYFSIYLLEIGIENLNIRVKIPFAV